MTPIEQALAQLFAQHRLVFWYDEQGGMRPDFEQLQLPAGVERLLVAEPGHHFALKHRLLREQPQQQLLLYFPFAPPADADNWLLDLQLSGACFSADLHSLWLQELGLPERLLRPWIAQREAFFRSQERRRALGRRLQQSSQPLQQPDQLDLLLLAQVLDAEQPEAYHLLTALAAALQAGQQQAYEKQLQRYGLWEPFWQLMHSRYAYTAAEPSAHGLLLHLFGQHSVLLRQQEMPHPEGALLFRNWKDSREFLPTFRELSERIAADLEVERLLQQQSLSVQQLAEEDLFALSDRYLLQQLVRQLLAGGLRTPDLQTYLERRRKLGDWSTFASHYQCLWHAAQLLELVPRLLRDAQPELPQQMLERYAMRDYQVDQHYRLFTEHYRATDHLTLLQELNAQVQKAYANTWLPEQSQRWNALLPPCPEQERAQVGFFAREVAPKLQKQRVVVLISDALRYECGQELAEQLRQAPNMDCELDYQCATLPSYTQLGMAALLPPGPLAVVPDSDAVTLEGRSTQGLEARKALLQAAVGPKATAIGAEELMAMRASEEGRALLQAHDLIYVYHNRIDKVGDNTTSETKVFEAVREELAFLQNLLRKLFSSMNASLVLLTADHGFLYQSNPLEEADFLSESPQGEVWKENRRFVLGRNLSVPAGMRLFAGQELGLQPADLQVLLPKGVGRLRVRGAGSQYVHGGASLQELMLPLLRVRALRASQQPEPVEVDVQQSGNVLSTNAQVVEFTQQQPVGEGWMPRTLQAFFQAPDGRTISDVCTHTFDSAEALPKQRAWRHSFMLEADTSSRYRNEQVQLVLRTLVAGQAAPYKQYTYRVIISMNRDFDF